MKPKVTLVTWTQFPIQTIYALWEASKTNRDFKEICQEATNEDWNDSPTKEAMEIFKKVVDAKIPVAENISFTFLLENVSVSFREQMVRHRIGVKVGDRLGADIIPDLADSTWWSQSMRILDMGSFAEEGRFRTPESLEGKFIEVGDDGNAIPAADYFWMTMKAVEKAYRELVAAGVPLEDAREVIPVGATHRISWTLNLAAIQHIVGKRGCQILQGDLWEPIIVGMVNEMAEKVDPYFRTLIAPPCVKNGKFQSCLFKIDNERRLDGRDEVPPCTLWLNREADGLQANVWKAHASVPTLERFIKMKDQYTRIWGHDAETYDEPVDTAKAS